MTKNEDIVSLSKIIRQVHINLLESEKSRIESGLPRLFKVSSLSLELNVAITKSTNIKGGIGFQVLSIGSSKEVAKEEINKITLTLDVCDKSGEALEDLPPGILPSNVYETEQ